MEVLQYIWLDTEKDDIKRKSLKGVNLIIKKLINKFEKIPYHCES